MEALKSIKFEHIVQAIIVIVIGVVFLIWAPAVIPLFAKMLAVLLFLIGVVFVVAYFFKKEKGPMDSGQFAAGILIAAVGAWIFFNPATFTDFIPRLFGVFIILSGLRNLGQTFSLLQYKYDLWWIALILAVITLGLGGYLVFHATEAKEFFVRLIGGFLVYDGVSNLWTISRISKFAKKIRQAAKDADAVETSAEIVDSKSGR